MLTLKQTEKRFVKLIVTIPLHRQLNITVADLWVFCCQQLHSHFVPLSQTQPYE